MSRTTNQSTHLTKSKRSLPKSALSPTDKAINALLEILTAKKTKGNFDFDINFDRDNPGYAYDPPDRLKAAEIILKYAPEKRTETPQN